MRRNEDGVPLVPDEFKEHVNGCSVPLIPRRIANGWWADACDYHDTEYHSHKNWKQKIKDDFRLWWNMMKSVPGKPTKLKRVAFFIPNLFISTLYFSGVSIGGWGYFYRHDLEQHIDAAKAQVVRIQVSS